MGDRVLCFIPTYGDRRRIVETITGLRASAGHWFDLLVCSGAPSPSVREILQVLHEDSSKGGIQYLNVWPENRGQHHATALALTLARREDYDWLLRCDDDVEPRTKRWLRKMLDRLAAIKEAAEDEHFRCVAAPRITGLRNALEPIGTTTLGVDFPVDLMDRLGGVCRLHPVPFLNKFRPPLYDPKGRGDPESIASYVDEMGGLLLRFPDIRMGHNTDRIEALDSPEEAHVRRMGWYWPYLGPTEISP